jgi:DNA-binding NtrC family response regulator
MKYKYKVLIIDQDEEVLCSLKKLLEKEGYIVETIVSATNALEKVKSNKYHIVLIGIEMTELDGVELLKEIKNYDSMTQVIMMTMYSSIDKILRSLEYGANDYLYKPLDNIEYVINVIDYSAQKLNRWREAIIQIVK